MGIKKHLLVICFSLTFIAVHSQHTVRLIVSDPARNTEMYVTGSFNNWNPGDINYKLSPLDSAHMVVTLRNISPGKHLFKFTRGDWSTVESEITGIDINDRVMEISRDTTLNLVIKGWVDEYRELTGFPDTTQMQICRYKFFYYLERDLDSSYKYGKLTYDLSKKAGNKAFEVDGLLSMANALQMQGNTGKALELYLKAKPLAVKLRDSFSMAVSDRGIGEVFEAQKDYAKAKSYYLDALKYSSTDERMKIPIGLVFLGLGRIYFDEGKPDSATFYAGKADQLLFFNSALLLLGDIHKKSGDSRSAMTYYRYAINRAISANSPMEIADAYLRLVKGYLESNQLDSGYYYARKAFTIASQVKNPGTMAEAGSLLAKLFEKDRKLDSAFVYQQLVLKINDSLFSREKERQAHTLLFSEQLHQQELKAEQAKFKSRTWIYFLSGGFALLLLTAGLLFRNNRQKQTANALLQTQKEQIQSTLTELKSTQSLLIQSEKMASLGELTAGIAHEIQNPLNFVNNFSEINKELLEELLGERQKGAAERNSSLEDELLNDIAQNEAKINHHGKRADAIVKGMLQHSRSSSGVKEPTDINALADEYLRLAYHGLRAKDKSFNATVKTDYDENIGNINIIPQDIGRVILNLITNAFYAATERLAPSEAEVSRSAASLPSRQVGTGSAGGFSDPDYKHNPTVWVSTKKISDNVLISVRDNGPGIPLKILDKIFQPFFTTKPTGQGTGLGLSLSYDIVKAHGGEIKVETTAYKGLPGEETGTTFTIMLPV